MLPSVYTHVLPVIFFYAFLLVDYGLVSPPPSTSTFQTPVK